MAKKSGRPPKGGGKKAASSKVDWKQALVAGLVALAAGAVYFRLTNSLRYIETTDSEQLKDVYFGRSPWVVLCTNDTESVHETFEAVSRTMIRDPLQFGVVDCTKPIKSGKSTLQRLKLNGKQRPTVFFSGYGRRPKQLQPKLLASEYVLIRELKALTKLHALKLKDAKQLRDACLGKATCGVVLAGGELETSALKTLNQVSDRFPWMQWVVIDASRHRLKNPTEDEVGLAGFANRAHRLLLVRQDNSSDAEGRAVATPHVGPFSAPAMASFLSSSFSDASVDPSYSFDPKGVLFMKRKEPPPPPPSPSPSASPTPQEQVLPTEEVEKRRAARRATLEAQRRARMDAEAEEFGIGEGAEDEEDEEESAAFEESDEADLDEEEEDEEIEEL